MTACLTHAGLHRQGMHDHLVQPPGGLRQVKAAEIRIRNQAGVVGIALALRVSTRWWRAGELSAHRDLLLIRRRLIRRLLAQVRACALPGVLLCGTDGWCADLRAMRETCRDAVRTGARGRPRRRGWRGLLRGQVVTWYEKRRVITGQRRRVQGSTARVEHLRYRLPGDGVRHTASVECLHATCRARLASLTRWGPALVRQTGTVRHDMYPSGIVYTCCTPYARVRLTKTAAGRACVERPPVMAARITDPGWRVRELLPFHVPPPRWTPPPLRGRPSQTLRLLMELPGTWLVKKIL